MKRPLTESMDEDVLRQDVVLTARREALRQAVIHVGSDGMRRTNLTLRIAEEFEEWLLREEN